MRSEDQIICGQKIKKDEWEWKKNWIVHISERTQTFFFPQYFLLTWNTRVPSDIKYPVVMGRFKNITCVCGFCRSLLISPIFRVYRIRNDCQRSNVRRTLIMDKTVKNSRHFKLHLLRWMINLKKLRLLLNQQNERELWLIANFKLYQENLGHESDYTMGDKAFCCSIKYWVVCGLREKKRGLKTRTCQCLLSD